MEEYLPPSMLLLAPIVIKYVMDALTSAWPKAPGWAKVGVTYAISVAIVRVYMLDIIALMAGHGQKSLGGYLLTGLVVASLASKAVHPTVEALRGIAREHEET